MKKASAKGASSSSSGKGATKKRVPPNTKGCCTIEYDNKPDEQVEGVTRAECTRIARARGGTGQWNKGACA